MHIKSAPMDTVMNDPMLKLVAEKMLRHSDLKNEPEVMYKLWSKWGNKPIIKKMREVVERKVTGYHRDFYFIDMSFMAGTSFSVPFLWIVWSTGTDMHMLTKNVTSVAPAIKYRAQDPDNEVYFVNPKNSTLIRIL